MPNIKDQVCGGDTFEALAAASQGVAVQNKTVTIPLWLANDLLNFCEANAELPKRETLIPIGAINAFRAAIAEAK